MFKYFLGLRYTAPQNQFLGECDIFKTSAQILNNKIFPSLAMHSLYVSDTISGGYPSISPSKIRFALALNLTVSRDISGFPVMKSYFKTC